MKMVRVGRLELPASCSQSKRATNCATPGYEVFQLWSNMGSKTLPDQGRQVSASPGPEAFFRERSYTISSSCWAASMAARLSRIWGSSYDFLRHIQQEQWIFPLDSRPAAPCSQARTFSSPPSWRRIVSLR